MCAKFEEQHGLLNHCIETYDRMIDFVDVSRRYLFLKLYVAKVAELLGLPQTRPIFEKGLHILNEGEKVHWGVSFIEVEKKLGEIDRARQLFSYLSQFCEPMVEEYNFWKVRLKEMGRLRDRVWQRRHLQGHGKNQKHD